MVQFNPNKHIEMPDKPCRTCQGTIRYIKLVGKEKIGRCPFCTYRSSRKWQKENGDYFRKYTADNAEKIREQNNNWVSRNRDAERIRSRINAGTWKANNPAKVKAGNMRRAGLCEKATPKWLTEDQWSEMNAAYKERDRLTKETGLKHHVDHIVPLQGKNVCGLHVPWNLQVIPATENLIKGNKLNNG